MRRQRFRVLCVSRDCGGPGSKIKLPDVLLSPTGGLLSQVSVLYFAKSAELTGVKAEEIPVATPVSGQQLWGLLLQRHPRCCGLLKAIFVLFRVCTHACN